MLQRDPDKRCTLEEVATDPWLCIDCNISTFENLPLILREQLNEEEQAIIINRMVNGGISTKEEIIE